MQLAIIKALLKFFPSLFTDKYWTKKGTPPMDDRAICLPWDKNFAFDTPRTDSSLRRIKGNLLKFTREYEDILACQYPLGQTLKNHP